MTIALPAPRRGYQCLTDFEHELGSAAGGIEVYASLEDLRRHRGCADECGVVEVSVSARAVVVEPGKPPTDAPVHARRRREDAEFSALRIRMLRSLGTQIVASCECATKTPEPGMHRTDCRYRLLEEACIALARIPVRGQ